MPSWYHRGAATRGVLGTLVAHVGERITPGRRVLGASRPRQGVVADPKQLGHVGRQCDGGVGQIDDLVAGEHPRPYRASGPFCRWIGPRDEADEAHETPP